MASVQEPGPVLGVNGHVPVGRDDSPPVPTGTSIRSESEHTASGVVTVVRSRGMTDAVTSPVGAR
jgi:hypothetical protein